MFAALALAAGLFFGLSDALAGSISRSTSLMRVAAAAQLVGLIVLLPVSASAIHVGHMKSALVIPAMGAGLTAAVGIVAAYAALARGPMSIVGPAISCGVLVPVVAGLARGERIHPSAFLGACLAIAGILVIAGGIPSRSHASLGTILLALLAAVSFGFGMVFMALGAEQSVRATSLIGRALTVSLLIPVAMNARTRRQACQGRDGRHPSRREWLLRALGVTAIGTMDALATLCYMSATTTGPVALVAVLSVSGPATVMVFGHIVHHERLPPVQWLGAASVLAGVVLVSRG